MPRWVEILKQIAPVVLAVVPGVPPGVAQAVAAGIAEADAIPGASGPDKKAHVMAIAKDALEASLPNATAVQKMAVTMAVSSGVDTTVATVNAIHELHQVAPQTP